MASLKLNNENSNKRKVLTIHNLYSFMRFFLRVPFAGFLNPMGEGISAGMESGYCAACVIMEHFDNPKIACVAYR